MTGLLLSGARGDWIPPPDTAIKTGTKPVAAFFHTLCVKHMFEIAKALNKVAEANIYKARYARRPDIGSKPTTVPLPNVTVKLAVPLMVQFVLQVHLLN